MEATTERFSIDWKGEISEVYRVRKNWRFVFQNIALFNSYLRNGNCTKITTDAHVRFVCQIDEYSDMVFGGK